MNEGDSFKVSPKMFLLLWNKFNSLTLVSAFLFISRTAGYQRYLPSMLNFMIHDQQSLKSKLNITSDSEPIKTCSLGKIPRIPIKETWEEELDEDFLMMPIGLKNLRNTCYLNSVLQSLYLLQLYSMPIMRKDWKFKKNSIGTEITRLFQEMDEKTGSSSSSSSSSFFRNTVVPKDLADAMKINIYEQEDAEETLLHLLNKIDESLLSVSSSSSSTKTNYKTNSLQFAPSDVFSCQLQQFIHCIDHDNHLSSVKTLKYFDLSLAIDESTRSLKDSLKKYFEPEYLIGQNQYKCGKFGLTNGLKTIRISKFPKLLIIHLKRFSFDEKTFAMKKVSFVLFSLFSLSLILFLSSSSSSYSSSSSCLIRSPNPSTFL
jgi:ubiquitin C-terminal hydrolase